MAERCSDRLNVLTISTWIPFTFERAAQQFQMCWYWTVSVCEQGVKISCKSCVNALSPSHWACPWLHNPQIIPGGLWSSGKAIPGRKIWKMPPLAPVLWKRDAGMEAAHPLSSQINWLWVWMAQNSSQISPTLFSLLPWQQETAIKEIPLSLNVFTQNLQPFPAQTLPNLGCFLTTRAFFCCLSVLLRPEFRTLFSPVAWAGFQTLCPILLNVSAALECVQVIPDKSLLLDSLKLNLTLNPGLHFVEDLSSKWDWVSRLGSGDLWGLEGVEVLAWSSASNSKVKLCWEEHRVVQGI